MTASKYIAALFILSAWACGTTPTPPGAMAEGIARTVSEVMITEGDPVTTADLEIGGMSCMMSCGRSVEKALATLPGVSNTTIEFNEGDEVADHAIVTYDESKVSDAQMIEAINAVHSGAYKVLAVKIIKQVKGNAPAATPLPTEGAPVEGAEDGQASVEDAPKPSVESVIPTLLALLSRIARI